MPSNAPYQAVCSFFCRSTPPDNALLSENVSNTGGVVAGVEFATSDVALEEFAGELGDDTKRQFYILLVTLKTYWTKKHGFLVFRGL